MMALGDIRDDPFQIDAGTGSNIAYIGTILDPEHGSLRRENSILLDKLASPVRNVIVQFSEHAIAISGVDDIFKPDGARLELFSRVAEVGNVAGHVLNGKPNRK